MKEALAKIELKLRVPPLISDESDVQLLFDAFESKLKEGKIHSQKCNKNQQTFSLKWQFGLGRTTNALRATGFTFTC